MGWYRQPYGQCAPGEGDPDHNEHRGQQRETLARGYRSPVKEEGVCLAGVTVLLSWFCGK